VEGRAHPEQRIDLLLGVLVHDPLVLLSVAAILLGLESNAAASAHDGLGRFLNQAVLL
jgi:hypothetical protein